MPPQSPAPSTPPSSRKRRAEPEPNAEAETATPSLSTTTPNKRPRTPRTPRIRTTSAKATPSKGPRTPRTPRVNTPSKAALKKAETVRRTQHKADWKQWVEEHKWTYDPSYAQQPGTEEIHRTEAKTYYRPTQEELDTLPHWEFENENNPSAPGRSYRHALVRQLVARKHAYLAGLHRTLPDVDEGRIFREGMDLFREAFPDRSDRRPQVVIVLSQKKKPFSPTTMPLPRRNGGFRAPAAAEEDEELPMILHQPFDPCDLGDDCD
ncbi:hypothetical protein F4778DRAFT_555031 [Xylariomycetidae sp. FL2044]|nr:hypothetical protein F4778DRAFT_555031 [Xylariomycetidae sp. FL2044]